MVLGLRIGEREWIGKRTDVYGMTGFFTLLPMGVEVRETAENLRFLEQMVAGCGSGEVWEVEAGGWGGVEVEGRRRAAAVPGARRGLLRARREGWRRGEVC